MKQQASVNDVSHSFSILERLQFGFTRRLELQRQTEAAECGLACLAMIASFHGHTIDIASLRRRFSISLKGATLQQLVEIARSLKLTARPVRLELNELKDLQLPCILHWNLDHFVVLKSVNSDGVVIHDPARGKRRLTISEISDQFTGIALELSPAAAFQKKVERQRVRLRQMMGNVVGLKRSLTQIALLALVLEGLSLFAPLFNQWVVDQVIVTGDLDLLLTLAIGFGGLKIISVAIEAIRAWAVIVMSTSMNVQWLANLFMHLVALPISYFEKRHMGDVVSRFNSIHAIQATLTTSFIGAILDGVMTIGTLIMMLIYSPQLTMVAAAAALLYIVLRTCFYAALMAATESAIVYEAKQQSMFMETIRGIQSLRLFAKEKERATKWINIVVDQKNAGLRTERLQLLFHTGNNLLFGFESIIVMGIGAKMVIVNQFSVGMLFAFIAYKTQFSSRISNLVDKFFELKMLGLQGERLADIALTEAETDASAFMDDIGGIEASLEIKNLAFSYGAGEDAVFANVSCRIEAGESVAIVGPSGCGKTTFIKVLLGIHKQSFGEIYVGGISLRQLGISNYRKMIGSVMQDDHLFAGTVGENICFFENNADQKWIEACGKMAALHDEILAMPMGYSTMVGDMGSTLSGGQKQRLLLARALYRKPSFLILDEATSHLDIANEKTVTEVIKTLPLTRIIVAHRQETIAGADRVIHMGRPAAPRSEAPAAVAAPALGAALGGNGVE